jgi:hypothetical protein
VVYGWTHAPLFVQREILTTGWAGLASITALQTLMMVLRILRPSRGLRPWAEIGGVDGTYRLTATGNSWVSSGNRTGHR